MSGGEMLVINGIWIPTIATPVGVSDLTWSHVADGGCEQATWSMNLDPKFLHPAIETGAPVEVMAGPEPLWAGTLAEPDYSDEVPSFSAAGAGADLRRRLALDSDGNITSVPDVAIDTAIANGLPITRPNSLSTDPYASSDDTVVINRTGDLLDAWSDHESVRWGINGRREAYAAPDPTEPAWYLTAGSGKVGTADDEYASDLYGRYKSGAATYATVHVSDPIASAQNRVEEPVDLTLLGLIDSTKATAVLNGMLAKGKARYAWTAPLTPSRLQITTPGGQPAYLPFVKGGDMARLFGVMDAQGVPVPYFDFIIGRTEYTRGSDTITISPVNLAPRTLSNVLNVAVGA